jgi:hypothetical protein
LEYKEGKFDGTNLGGESTPLETKKLSQENDQLKKLLGEKHLEMAILRNLIKKKLIEKLEIADKWMVLKIIGIPRSTYYYQKNGRVKEKQVSEGRPAPGYSIQENGKKNLR